MYYQYTEMGHNLLSGIHYNDSSQINVVITMDIREIWFKAELKSKCQRTEPKFIFPNILVSHFQFNITFTKVHSSVLLNCLIKLFIFSFNLNQRYINLFVSCYCFYTIIAELFLSIFLPLGDNSHMAILHHSLISQTLCG